MNEKFDFGPETSGNTVYIRRVAIWAAPRPETRGGIR